MNIRYAKNEDLNTIKNIWNYCFRDEESFFNYYFPRVYLINILVMVES